MRIVGNYLSIKFFSNTLSSVFSQTVIGDIDVLFNEQTA